MRSKRARLFFLCGTVVLFVVPWSRGQDEGAVIARETVVLEDAVAQPVAAPVAQPAAAELPKEEEAPAAPASEPPVAVLDLDAVVEKPTTEAKPPAPPAVPVPEAPKIEEPAAIVQPQPVVVEEPAPKLEEPIVKVEPPPVAETKPAPVEEPPPLPTLEAISEGVTGVAAQPPATAGEPAVAPVVTTAAPQGEAASTAILEELRKREALRRQALHQHGMEKLKEADEAYKKAQYQKAMRLYEEAVRYIIERPDTRAARERARQGMANSLYGWALLLKEQQDFNTALDKARQAATFDHPQAPALVAELQRIITTGVPPPKVEVPKARWQQEEYKQQQEEIAGFLRRAREYNLTREYEKAKEAYESVLKRDPFNTEAIRMLHKLGQARLDSAATEREATRKNMVTDVVKTWNPRTYGIMEKAAVEQVQGAVKPMSRDEKGRMRILEKMEKIILPEVDFRQANINEVIKFLHEMSVQFDPSDDPAERKGVNIILNLGPTAGAAPAPAAGAALPGTLEGLGAVVGAEVPLVTFSARYISLLEALKIVTQVANLKYRIEGNVVMVVPLNAPEGDIIIRMYDVLPAVEEKIPQMGAEIGRLRGPGAVGGSPFEAAPAAAAEGTDWKQFFAEMGVKWPDGSSIKYVRSMGKLVVANTADNLAAFERVLEVLNVVPNQIEIEARFVEVAQTDLDSLGLEWLLTDNWELLTKKGQANLPPSARQRIQVNANADSQGFTKGNRYLTRGAISATGAGAVIADDILSISSILTNPELNLIVHALQQKGNADLLSAPKVTTKSGTEATIKVVTEYIYPTDFSVTEVTGTDAAGRTVVVGGIVEPGSFQTREVGVILQVLPEVSPEGHLINLTMTPEVVSEPEWKNYGSTYTDAQGNVQQLTMEQPFFHTRTVSTSIQIYNGATVVMGGMITETRHSVDDKIPLLGDIPLIGRLFRSKYDRSEKRNLLIFVTARLVDPAGRPIAGEKEKFTMAGVKEGAQPM